MQRTIFITGGCALWILLTLIQPGADERRRVQRELFAKKLPADCQIFDLGQFADIDRVVAINCDGRSTNTLNTKY
jgi:hypothetical protein